MMWWGHEFGWGWMMAGGLAMLLFFGGLIVLGFLAIRAFTNGNSRPESRSDQIYPGSSNRAVEILKERYACGEVTKAEYEEIRADLRKLIDESDGL